MSAARLAGVTLRLADRTVLENVSLDLPEGAFIGLLGPNGSGKTTLIRALLGLLPAARGSIDVFGAPARVGRRGIGYLPQFRPAEGSLRLSGRDYVMAAAGGARWGLPLHGRAERAEVDRAIEWVGAESLARRPVAALSGGERQRLRLAQGLLGSPRMLLLDEPLVSLDPAAQEAVVSLVRRLQGELGLTVLFSAHELNPLLPALDQVLYLGNRQAAIGEVDAVITGPVLSRLYDAPIDVVRLNGRIFVMSGAHDVQHGAHGCGVG